MAQSNNTVNFLIHDANGQPQFIKVVQAQAASPAKPISVVGSTLGGQTVKAIIKTQDGTPLTQAPGTTMFTQGHQVLRTIGIPATKNASGQRTTHVVTIPFQQAAGMAAGTPTKLLVTTPHKMGTATTLATTSSPGGEQLVLPRNAKIIASSPATTLRQIKSEPRTITSTPLTLDPSKGTFQFTGGKLAVGQKHFISPILDHSRKRKEAEAEYAAEYAHPHPTGGKRRKSEKGGKGLRHFSKKVCEKVRRKGTTSYNEVADELVSEFTNPANCFASVADQSLLQYDQKNIRRRVYDALNVLMAMNIISKEKKEIRWLGLPTNSQQECLALEKDKIRRAHSINQKMQQLQDLLVQQIAFKNLVERNRAAEAISGPPGPNSSIQLPFILVNTDKNTTIDCSISSDKREYQFSFDNKFEIHDDMEVLKRMGLAMGLDKGACSEDDLDRARSMVPPSLEPYVSQLAHGNLQPDFPVEVRTAASGSRRRSKMAAANATDDMEASSSMMTGDDTRADSASPAFDFSEEESDVSSDVEIN